MPHNKLYGALSLTIDKGNCMNHKLKIVRAGIAFAFIVLLATLCLCPTYALYESKNSLIGKFKTLCDAHRTYASYVSLGKTTQGRDIWVFRIGNPSGGVVMWDAQMHGSEDIGSEIELLMARWLLESNDPTAKSILSRNYVLFIPIIDVDTVTLVNGRHVNLNRNFVYRWGSNGDRNPSSWYYMGPYAGSERETQVMRNAFKVYHPKFYVNTHMWGGPRLYSWSGNNPTLVSQLKTKVAQISSQRHVTPYQTSSLSGSGYAVGDAGYYFKACAWLLEISGAGTPSYSTIASYYYPKCLPILIATCQLA